MGVPWAGHRGVREWLGESALRHLSKLISIDLYSEFSLNAVDGKMAQDTASVTVG